MTISEMNAKRAKAWDECKAFLEAHRTEDGVLSDEDGAKYDAMVKTVDDLEKEINRMKDIEARDAKLAAPTSNPITEPVNNGAATEKNRRATDEYHAAFIDHIHGRVMNTNDPLQEDTDAEGGYLVPTEFERTLIDGLRKVDPIFSLAKHITMGSHEKNVPIVASRGSAGLVSEEGSYPVDGDTFTQAVFKAYKFGRIIKASEELIADAAFNIEQYINDSLSYSLGKGEAGYFWTGTGSSQPQGVLTGAGTGVTAASASKITADEIIDLYYSVPEQYRANASWAFNDATVKEIRKLKDGNGQYLWTAALNGQPATILGRPVYTSEHIPTIATGAKVAAFGDFGYYWIGDRQGVTLKRLDQLYAANGQVGFRGSARTDGHVMLSDAIKVLKMA